MNSVGIRISMHYCDHHYESTHLMYHRTWNKCALMCVCWSATHRLSSLFSINVGSMIICFHLSDHWYTHTQMHTLHFPCNWEIFLIFYVVYYQCSRVYNEISFSLQHLPAPYYSLPSHLFFSAPPPHLLPIHLSPCASTQWAAWMLWGPHSVCGVAIVFLNARMAVNVHSHGAHS